MRIDNNCNGVEFAKTNKIIKVQIVLSSNVILFNKLLVKKFLIKYEAIKTQRSCINILNFYENKIYLLI